MTSVSEPTTGTEISPFRAEVPDEVLTDLRRRIAGTRWPHQIEGTGWSRGADRSYLQELARYWHDDFDWRSVEATMNAWSQFTTVVDGQRLHFVHVSSPEPSATPLLLLHGWPSSPLEFAKIIGPLTDPVAHGGDAADAFEVVVPTLPGFGFSGPTTEAGWHTARIADALAELMTRLGHDRFSIHGGDFGSVVASQVALRHSARLAALHVTFVITAGLLPEDGEPTEEEAQLAAAQQHQDMVEGGYFAMQASKPQTLAYSLTDSPVGQAAWIVEKLTSWVDHDGDLESVLTKDEILAMVTLPWVTGTAGSSAQLYFESAVAGLLGPTAERIETPTSVAIFPKELYRASRRVASRHYNVVRWSPQERGGHFAALEQPEALVADIRASFRSS